MRCEVKLDIDGVHAPDYDSFYVEKWTEVLFSEWYRHDWAWINLEAFSDKGVFFGKLKDYLKEEQEIVIERLTDTASFAEKLGFPQESLSSFSRNELKHIFAKHFRDGLDPRDTLTLLVESRFNLSVPKEANCNFLLRLAVWVLEGKLPRSGGAEAKMVQCWLSTYRSRFREEREKVLLGELASLNASYFDQWLCPLVNKCYNRVINRIEFIYPSLPNFDVPELVIEKCQALWRNNLRTIEDLEVLANFIAYNSSRDLKAGLFQVLRDKLSESRESLPDESFKLLSNDVTFQKQDILSITKPIAPSVLERVAKWGEVAVWCKNFMVFYQVLHSQNRVTEHFTVLEDLNNSFADWVLHNLPSSRLDHASQTASVRGFRNFVERTSRGNCALIVLIDSLSYLESLELEECLLSDLAGFVSEDRLFLSSVPSVTHYAKQLVLHENVKSPKFNLSRVLSDIVGEWHSTSLKSMSDMRMRLRERGHDAMTVVCNIQETDNVWHDYAEHWVGARLRQSLTEIFAKEISETYKVLAHKTGRPVSIYLISDHGHIPHIPKDIAVTSLKVPDGSLEVGGRYVILDNSNRVEAPTGFVHLQGEEIQGSGLKVLCAVGLATKVDNGGDSHIGMHGGLSAFEMAVRAVHLRESKVSEDISITVFSCDGTPGGLGTVEVKLSAVPPDPSRCSAAIVVNENLWNSVECEFVSASRVMICRFNGWFGSNISGEFILFYGSQQKELARTRIDVVAKSLSGEDPSGGGFSFDGF